MKKIIRYCDECGRLLKKTPCEGCRDGKKRATVRDSGRIPLWQKPSAGEIMAEIRKVVRRKPAPRADRT